MNADLAISSQIFINVFASKKSTTICYDEPVGKGETAVKRHAPEATVENEPRVWVF